MEKTAISYIFDALYILKTNILYVLPLIILSSALCFSPILHEHLLFSLYAPIGITLFIITPLIYGQFIEIINTGHKDSWVNVYNNYWMKVFLVSLVLKVPLIPFVFVGAEMNAVNEIITIIVAVNSIYILPLVLLKQDIISSVSLGLKCLFCNLKFNSPIVFILIFSMGSQMLITPIIKNYNSQLFLYIFSIAFNFFSIFVEFALFITAILVLKEKLFVNKE